jgi:hypothetical protein
MLNQTIWYTDMKSTTLLLSPIRGPPVPVPVEICRAAMTIVEFQGLCIHHYADDFSIFPRT